MKPSTKFLLLIAVFAIGFTGTSLTGCFKEKKQTSQPNLQVRLVNFQSNTVYTITNQVDGTPLRSTFGRDGTNPEDKSTKNNDGPIHFGKLAVFVNSTNQLYGNRILVLIDTNSIVEPGFNQFIFSDCSIYKTLKELSDAVIDPDYSEVQFVPAVHLSQAERLRRQAARIERQERAIAEFRDLLSYLEALNRLMGLDPQ